MNGLDFVIIAMVTVPALLGWRTGLVSAVLTLGGVVGGFLLAGQLSGWVAALLSPLLAGDAWSGFLGFALVLVGTIVVSWVAAFFVKKVLAAAMLGWVDPLGGALLGAAMGSFLVTVLLLILRAVGQVGNIAGIKGSLEGSALAGPFLQYVGAVVQLLPVDVTKVVGGG
ncbi:MAG: CvpA family protein [Chloroflexi bacterium]|nr:CvpA family protein [Chloroflexota bacterium]